VSEVPQPLLVATEWGAAAVVPLGSLLAVVALSGFFYRRALRRASAPPLALVLALAACGLAAACFSPVLFSSDAYAYAAYGEMARIGLNPYALAPMATHDAIVRAAQLQWVTAFPICVYGPAFVAFARLIVTLFAPLGPLAQLDAFRFASSAALLLCIPLAFHAFPGDRAQRLRAAATIALNPAAIWCAAEGHNDAIALAVLLTGFAFVARGRIATGAAIAALSALIKPPGVAAALALGFVDRRARAGALLGIAVAGALAIPLLRGVATGLARHGVYAPQASLQAVVAPVSPVLAWILALAIAAALAVRGAALVRNATMEGWIYLALAGWVLVPNPYPWYGVWLIAVAALDPRSRAGNTAILLSLTAMLRYIPDAIAVPPPPLASLLGLLAALPLLQLLPFAGRYNVRPS